MTSPPLPWPDDDPLAGSVRLRAFTEGDVDMVVELSGDPYVPLTGSLPPHCDRHDARAYIERQHDRARTGYGWSFCIADADSDEPLGQAGLWLAGLPGGRAAAGYCVAPPHRGRGRARDALVALTAFAWRVPDLHRVELYIEPWNQASVRTAEAAGYSREGLLRRHQEIGGRRVDMLIFDALRPERRIRNNSGPAPVNCPISRLFGA